MNQRATPKPSVSVPEPRAPKPVHDPTPDRPGNTTPQLDGETAPRLPHERDESADSQTGVQQPIIEQARRDVEDGQVDTDRGPVLEKLYAEQVSQPNEKPKESP